MNIQEFLDKILEKEESYIFAEVLEADTERSHKKTLAKKAAKKLGLNYSRIGDDELSSDPKFWVKLGKKAADLAKQDYQNFLDKKKKEIEAKARALKDFGFFNYDPDDLEPEIKKFVEKHYAQDQDD